MRYHLITDWESQCQVVPSSTMRGQLQILGIKKYTVWILQSFLNALWIDGASRTNDRLDHTCSSLHNSVKCFPSSFYILSNTFSFRTRIRSHSINRPALHLDTLSLIVNICFQIAKEARDLLLCAYMYCTITSKIEKLLDWFGELKITCGV